MRFITPLIRHIERYLPSHKYFMAGLILFTSYTFAADTTKDSDVIEAIVQIVNLLFTIITFLLTPAVILAGWLLSPDWTMGDFFGLRPYFIQIWVLVSNLVYIIFALMLLWMAVLQIFSGESDYAFKKRLPRFLMGIMIVPFTWLIVSWTLSFANQAVAAVLSIPSGAIAQMQTDEEGGVFHLRTIPTKFVLNFAEDAPGANAESVGCGNNGTTSDGTKCISPAEFIANNQSGPFFIIMIYAYDIFKIQKTEMVDFASVCGGTEGNSVDTRTCISDLGKLLRKFGVAFITTTFFAIILIALCWVLLARAFKLWIYVMFSPLFGLAFALGEGGLGESLNSEGGGGGGGGGAGIGKLGFKAFFSLAMVPVLVSAVLSFGILFIGVVNNTFTTGSLSDNGSGTFCTSGEFMVKYCIEQSGDEGGYSSRIIIGGDGSEGGGDYAITFEFGSMLSEFVGSSAGNTLSGAAEGFADGAKDIFAHIILSLIALAVMWMGVKAAVSADEVTKMAFAPFERFGNSVGKLVMNIPSYIPTPHPAFAAFNPATFDALAAGINKNVDTTVSESRTRLADMINGSQNNFNRAVDGYVSGTSSFKEAVNRFGDTSAKSPEEAQKLLKEGLKKVDATIDTNNPDRTAFENFKKDIDNANPKEIKGILQKHDSIVVKLDNGTLGGGEMAGVGNLSSQIGANTGSSSSNTSPIFPNYTILPDGKISSSGGTDLKSGDMNAEQKGRIHSIFPNQSAIPSMLEQDVKTKLKQAGFADTQVKALSYPNALKAAESLAKEAGSPL